MMMGRAGGAEARVLGFCAVTSEFPAVSTELETSVPVTACSSTEFKRSLLRERGVVVVMIG